ncbi:MAG: BamA/TamA family outer membrane protein [Candidatus Eisenbacteria bacterium]
MKVISTDRRNSARTRGARPSHLLAAGLAVLAAALLWASCARGQTPATPRMPQIERIDFVGAEHLSGGKLREVMRLRQKVWWKPFQKTYFYGTDHLERDLERVLALYREEGFVFARVEEVVVRHLKPERVALEIHMSEGPRMIVSTVEVRGAEQPLAARLARLVTLRRGMPLRESRLQEQEQRLLLGCHEEGLALAAINREVRLRGDSAEVWLWIEPGPRVRVGDLRIEGLERTRPAVVRGEITLDRGDLLRRSEILAAQERLFELGLFRTVRLQPAYPDSLPDLPATGEIVADLTVALAEKSPGWIAFGGGVSSEEEVRLVGEWGYRNLFGRAHGLMLSGLISHSIAGGGAGSVRGVRERKIEANYSQPGLFGWPLRWHINPYYRFQREPTFEEDIYGLLLGGHRTIGRYERLAASLENKWIATTDSTAGRSEYQTRFLSLALIDDRRDFPLDPRYGRLAQVRGEYAGGFLGGAASFTRWIASTSFYIPLHRSITWALRARAGHIAPVGRGVGSEGEARPLLRVPFDERFRAGGGTSVRGYSEKSLGPYTADGQALGGLALLLFNVEMRFRLFWQLGGAVFLDAGNVWEDYRQITWRSWSRGWSGSTYSEVNAACSVGGGLRLQTPVGPLRLDYGLKVNRHRRPGTAEGEWHFSLGQAY